MNTVKSLDIPFPVEIPFAMRPHMRPLKNTEKILSTDHLFEDYIEEKKLKYNPVYGDNVDINLVKSAAGALKKYDNSFSLDNTDGLIYKMTMSLQEDFVIFSPNKQGNLSAQVLSVCFPSGWDPRKKANMTFSEIHAPLADADLIKKNAEHIAKMICTKGPFVRHVWSLSNSGTLGRHPDTVRPWTNETLDQMWYRCERQVTIPIDGKAALFLIRMYVQPLSEVFKDTDKRKAIIDSVNSMSDAVIAYKGFEYLKDYFNQHVV
jgi:hypothetical protein